MRFSLLVALALVSKLQCECQSVSPAIPVIEIGRDCPVDSPDYNFDKTCDLFCSSKGCIITGIIPVPKDTSARPTLQCGCMYPDLEIGKDCPVGNPDYHFSKTCDPTCSSNGCIITGKIPVPEGRMCTLHGFPNPCSNPTLQCGCKYPDLEIGKDCPVGNPGYHFNKTCDPTCSSNGCIITGKIPVPEGRECTLHGFPNPCSNPALQCGCEPQILLPNPMPQFNDICPDKKDKMFIVENKCGSACDPQNCLVKRFRIDSNEWKGRRKWEEAVTCETPQCEKVTFKCKCKRNTLKAHPL